MEYKPITSYKQKHQSSLLDGLTRIQRAKLSTLIQGNRTFRRAFSQRFDITDEIDKDFQHRLYGDIPQHFVIQIYGPTGSGKSETAQQIALKYAPSMDNIHIYMQHHELIKGIRTAKEGDIVLLDEQPLKVGMGARREDMQLINLEEVTRKFRLSFIFVSPSPRIHSSAHYWLRTMIMDTKKRVNILAVQDPETGICLGNIKVAVPKESPFREKYNKKKDEFIEKTVTGKLRGGYLISYAKEIIEGKEYQSFKLKLEEKKLKMTRTRISMVIQHHFPGLTKGENNKLIEYIKLFEVNPDLGYQMTNKENGK